MEIANVDAVYKEKWEFPDLIKELQEGILSKKDYPLYMFMGGQRTSEIPLTQNFFSDIFFDSCTMERNNYQYSIYCCFR